MTRKIVDRNTINSNGNEFGQTFPLARGVKTNAYIQITLSGTLTGTNTLEVILQSTPNPHDRDAAIFFDEEDKSAFPQTLFTAEEVDGAGSDGITRQIHIEDGYGVGRMKFTRAGTGSNTFIYSVWMSP